MYKRELADYHSIQNFFLVLLVKYREILQCSVCLYSTKTNMILTELTSTAPNSVSSAYS